MKCSFGAKQKSTSLAHTDRKNSRLKFQGSDIDEISGQGQDE
jgi:hypothetical protein